MKPRQLHRALVLALVLVGASGTLACGDDAQTSSGGSHPGTGGDQTGGFGGMGPGGGGGGVGATGGGGEALNLPAPPAELDAASGQLVGSTYRLRFQLGRPALQTPAASETYELQGAAVVQVAP